MKKIFVFFALNLINHAYGAEEYFMSLGGAATISVPTLAQPQEEHSISSMIRDIYAHPFFSLNLLALPQLRDEQYLQDENLKVIKRKIEKGKGLGLGEINYLIAAVTRNYQEGKITLEQIQSIVYANGDVNFTHNIQNN